MKKLLILICVISLTGISGLVSFHILQASADIGAKPVYVVRQPVIDSPVVGTQAKDELAGINTEGEYEIYVDGKLYQRFDTYEEAISIGEKHERALVQQKGKSRHLWDNYPPYNVFTDNNTYTEFETFAEAVAYGKLQPKAYIYYRKNNELVWTNTEEVKVSHKIENVPWISQMPQLPRGCEVTSLSMLLNYKGVAVDKMMLADEIKKNPTPFRREKGVVYSGNPHNGFVGDMKDSAKHGLGVYHGPIYELLCSYLPNSALDLTSADFDDLLYFIGNDTPVWIIINSNYQKLPDSYFERWQTEDGEIKITYKEHSVLVTGYDELYVYFNDPLSSSNNRALKSDFIEAWIQMGSQAVTVTPGH